MRILHINSVPYGSTCRVMLGIAKAAQLAGYECDTAAGYSTHPVSELPDNHYQIGSPVSKLLHLIFAKTSGLNGCFSVLATLRLIARIKRKKYDLLHLHNLHGWYLHLPLLMRFIQRNQIPVVWTLHDCWAFTGQCAHYTAIGCQKWKTECHHCPQKHLYPQSLMDCSRMMHRAKKHWFASLTDAVLVTPSQWLADQLKASFLSVIPVRVIPNGMDLSTFHPAEGWQKTGKYMVLGVASDWTQRKGLDVFIELAGRLEEDYQIVMVGTNDHIDALLPASIISIHRTQDTAELAKLYTAADVFVNPTYEDNFPTVNLEALACGTPVVTFDAGGSAECLTENCGIAVPAGNVDVLEAAIRRVCTQKPFAAEECIRRAKQFDQNSSYQAYLELYRQKAGARP